MTDLELSFDSSGPSDGVPVLMIPPLGADRRFWEECRTRLGPRVRAIGVDLPGMGWLPAPGPVTAEVGADCIERLRDHLALDRVILMGCAVGAMAAIRYATQHPGRVRGMVLSNPGLRILGPAAENLEQRAGTVREQGMAALLPGAIDRAFEGYCGTERHRVYTERFAAQDAESYALSALGAAGTDTGPWLAEVACPTLLIGGGRDRLFPVEQHAREMAKGIPGARLVELAEGAHFMPFQIPDRIGRLARSFIEDEVLTRG